MLEISEDDIAARISRDNPWWHGGKNAIPEAAYGRRVYFESFSDQALNFSIRRASVLLGPRRVGKTVIAKQLVSKALDESFPQKNILYVSIDAPVYAGMALEKFLKYIDYNHTENFIVIFDEIQYLQDWERHLKDLVDAYPNVKFVATGSAAAALKLKSQESGAGRFTDFVLPPLTFHEFLVFTGRNDELITETFDEDYGHHRYTCSNIQELNKSFIEYLNYGGYPEVVINESIRSNVDQFVKNDIIDKVLLKDLPNLYGISNIQELNKLFSFIAYNTGSEANYEKLSQSSGISKPTIKRYMEYLESAFLIIKLPTVDENCRSLQRERNFKIYLNNPSMRAALFAPVQEDDSTRIGHLAEAAIFSQWQHSPSFSRLRYARWKNEGEVDVVYLAKEDQKPSWIVEIKWSDRIQSSFNDSVKNVRHLLSKHGSIESLSFTTKSHSSIETLNGINMEIVPSALYCYTVGRNITRNFEPSSK
ncbi:ATP-binding protein [Oceanicaulis sp.]|uniref:ATP-binding protein n=1 Tax=Oceanicaulis sp. TaxID=1924941 RepID=UPI003F71A62B